MGKETETAGFLKESGTYIDEIAKFLEANKANINWCYTGPSDQTKPIVHADNLLHLAARTKNIEKFLSIFKKGVESDVRLLEYNNDQENPFHIAAKMRILPDVVKGIFKYLESEQTNPNSDSKKLENVKSYVKDALGNRCALDKSKKTPLDWVSKTVRKEIKEIAGIKESLICNQKFRLFLYITGAMLCIAAMCLSLYFLFLGSQSLALGSIAGIASGGVAYLSGKVYSEISDLNSVSTPMEVVSNESLFSTARSQ